MAALGDDLRSHSPAYCAVGSRDPPLPAAGSPEGPPGGAGARGLPRGRALVALGLLAAVAGALALGAAGPRGRLRGPAVWGDAGGAPSRPPQLREVQLAQDRDLMVVMKSDPYDCGAGFNNWEAGWSTSKKEWCCINKGMGCEGDAKESWTVCDGDDNCGSNSFLQKWDKSPRELASQVDDGLASVPGIPDQVWSPVVERWQQNAPHFNGRAVWLEDIASFVKQLLADDPFGTGDSVPYVDFWAPGDGKVVAVTQRQLAFVVANVIMGNTIPAGDGLSAAVQRCAEGPERSDMVLSLLSMLAVLSQELQPGQAGTTLVGTAPAAGATTSWKNRLGDHTLKEPRLQLQIGDKRTGGLDDFMSGGVPFQALTDIAGNVVGGGAQLCATANSQDESLVQFYSEVLAFVFWTSEGRMLPVPWTLMGARRYINELSGESSAGEPFFNTCGRIHEKDWLNQDIPSTATSVKLGSKKVLVMASTFVALKSMATPGIGGDCGVGEAMNHNCEGQRNHLDDDMSMWYQAYEATMYPEPVRDAFTALVQHIGTGPWGAGVWFGDSQMYFLTVWLTTSLLNGASLDYYLYDHFCENPANQCFLLGEAGCGDCISTSAVAGEGPDAGRCGSQSLWGVIDHFKGMPAQDLYQALKDVGGPPTQVFDLLAPGAMGAPDVPDDPAPSQDAAPSSVETIQKIWSEGAAAAAENTRELVVKLTDSAEESVPPPRVETTEESTARPAAALEYSFAGYYTINDAQGACGGSAVAMPKTAEEQTALEDAVRRAIEAGDMSETWPRNTIWLGGRWSSDHWEWNDGETADRVDWAESQPSSTENQQDEPYLCLVAEGKVHDSAAGSPPYSFGVMCQDSAGEGASEGALLKVDTFPVLPVGDGWEAACLAGNDLDDGWEYVFNEGRGTSNAACGESADYWCCKRRAATSTSAAKDFWQQILTR